MSRNILNLVFSLMAIASASTVRAQAQLTTKDRAALAEASSSLRRHAPLNSGVVDLLTQSRGPINSNVISAVTDTLVAIATAPEGTAPFENQRNAVSALVLASRSSRGVVYQGGPAALYKIAIYNDGPTAIQAASALTALPDFAVTGPMIERLASTNSLKAFAVIRSIASSKSPPGSAELLRRLWDGSAVKNPEACSVLAMYASQKMWPATAATSCKI